MKVQYLFRNNKGRDFVCGDIHGCFELLEEKLSEVNFDPLRDRIFSVGDIIDRGMESIKALQYLEKSWFYCICGNHEQMFLNWIIEDSPTIRNDAFRFHMQNGGLWVTDYLGVHIKNLADDIYANEPISKKYPALNHWENALKKLPYAIEIKYGEKKTGIIHAEIPQSVTWPSLEAELNKPNVLNSILFSRKYIKSGKRKKYHINGVDELYCGHNIVDIPLKKGNINYIDTGAYLSQTLTLIELNESL